MASAQVQLVQFADVKTFVKQKDEKDLLRFTTAGSVDDGKSTLIGRLLYDSKGVYEDQIASVRNSPVNHSAGTFDLALLTDGLRAEREQGITIDVAYRYFSTSKRKFIIADTPGHEQYTRNMATGASTAELAVILIDARNGVQLQSRRHAFIASILGIQRLLVAVNKMDLVTYDAEVFTEICSRFTDYVRALKISHLQFIPISALHGDNVVEKSARTGWYQGPTILEYLESVPVANDHNPGEFRLPVQYVLRPHLNFRGYAGQVASGVIELGDPVMVLPSRRVTRVKSIVTYDGELEKAFAPMAVALCLQDELDVGRGDMLVDPSSPPDIVREFEAHIVWLDDQPLVIGRRYLLKHTTHTVQARVDVVRSRINVDNLENEPSERLYLNDIGVVTVSAQQALFCDNYADNRATGSFILIDPITNATAAAGMITGKQCLSALAHRNLSDERWSTVPHISQAEQQSRAGHFAITVWIEAEAPVSHRVERMLFDCGLRVHALSGEALPNIPELCVVLNEAGVIAIYQSNNKELRDRTRQYLGAENFLVIKLGKDGESAEAAVSRIHRFLEKRRLI